MTNSYTKPQLRKKIVAQVKASSSGGKPGQWSARKAQIANKKYKDAGGGFKGGKTEAQKKLSKWTKEKWTTSDGNPAIRKDSKGKTVTTRYLPEKAWKKLSASEKKATNAKKRAGSKKGTQFVSNTQKAKKSSRKARGG